MKYGYTFKEIELHLPETLDSSDAYKNLVTSLEPLRLYKLVIFGGESACKILLTRLYSSYVNWFLNNTQQSRHIYERLKFVHLHISRPKDQNNISDIFGNSMKVERTNLSTLITLTYGSKDAHNSLKNIPVVKSNVIGTFPNFEWNDSLVSRYFSLN